MSEIDKDIFVETLKALEATLEPDKNNPDIEYIKIKNYKYKFQFPGVFTAIKACSLFESNDYEGFAKLAFTFLHRDHADAPELNDKYFQDKTTEAMDWLLVLRGLLWRDNPWWREERSSTRK